MRVRGRNRVRVRARVRVRVRARVRVSRAATAHRARAGSGAPHQTPPGLRPCAYLAPCRPPATCLAAPRTPSHLGTRRRPAACPAAPSPALTPHPPRLASGASPAGMSCAALHPSTQATTLLAAAARALPSASSHTAHNRAPHPSPSQELDSLDTRSKEADEQGGRRN